MFLKENREGEGSVQGGRAAILHKRERSFVSTRAVIVNLSGTMYTCPLLFQLYM